MGDVVPFKRPKPSVKHKGRSLCASGFHRWVADKDKPFDTKAGKLVSRYVCSRCGLAKTESR